MGHTLSSTLVSEGGRVPVKPRAHQCVSLTSQLALEIQTLVLALGQQVVKRQLLFRFKHSDNTHTHTQESGGPYVTELLTDLEPTTNLPGLKFKHGSWGGTVTQWQPLARMRFLT